MSGATTIRAVGLAKHFGEVRALDGLDLSVEPGQVFGFVGPNGAGKSTAIRIFLDLIRPTSGEVHVLGQDPRIGGPALRARIGYLPGELRLPEQLTAGRYLAYLARLRNGVGSEQIAPLAEQFGLDLTRPIRKLSKGNKQKVGLIQAFMHRPELLILDEPTSGLDPLLQHEFQDLVQQRCSEGATVFMSSHVLSEIEDVANRVGVIRSGKLVDVDEIEALRHKTGQQVELRFAGPIADTFGEVPGLSDVVAGIDTRTGGSVVRGVLRGEPDQLIKVAARHHLVGIEVVDRTLEPVFLAFYRDAQKPVSSDA